MLAGLALKERVGAKGVESVMRLWYTQPVRLSLNMTFHHVVKPPAVVGPLAGPAIMNPPPPNASVPLCGVSPDGEGST